MYRARIGIYGKMNAGKSTLFNFLIGSNHAIVSSVAGTTTDPVRKTYEMLDFGPLTIIDTAGFDDKGDELADKRVQKSIATLDDIDVALFVPIDNELDEQELAFVATIDAPCIIVSKPFSATIFDDLRVKLKSAKPTKMFYGSHLSAGQKVLLVVPIDSEAPSGRLILPQVQALRAALDMNAYAMVVQPQQMQTAVAMFAPNLIVVDSQLFGTLTPPAGIPITSFSILLSDYKGDLTIYERGAKVIPKLKDGDKILLIEHCVHGVSCEDIARVKIPQALQRHGVKLNFQIVSGREPLPSDLTIYALAVQCGGCMTSARSIMSRIESCQKANLPITSYGILLRSTLGRHL